MVNITHTDLSLKNIMQILNVDYKKKGIYICFNGNQDDDYTFNVVGLAFSKCAVIDSDFNIQSWEQIGRAHV